MKVKKRHFGANVLKRIERCDGRKMYVFYDMNVTQVHVLCWQVWDKVYN